MKKLFKLVFFFFLFLGTSHDLVAQEIIDKLSRKLCRCLEKQEVKNPNGMRPCFESLLISNLNEIKKYYSTDTMEGIDMEEMGNKIGAKMIKECEYVMDTFPTGIVGNDDKKTKQPDLKCDDLKKGDFYYLTEIPEAGVLDTTYVTISNDMFLERMKGGRTYSLLNIKWKGNCEFDLIFKESNDPMKKEFSKSGDVYEYEILTNGSESFFIKTTWKKRSYQFELVKVK